MAELFVGDEALPGGGARPCVVKRLLPGAGETERRLFAREAKALAALRGEAHIVELYRAGPEAAAPEWLLLEWVEGCDLAALIEARRRRGRPLARGVAMAIGLGLTRALEALQAARQGEVAMPLVHRDVHPGNVLLGVDGAVKLADLGVVALGSDATQAGLKGTLVWMAPEQLRSGDTSAASDVYAAGLVLYELFTNAPSRPVGAAGIAELLAARDRLPPSPRTLRPDLPASIEAAILSALAVDPAQRPSARALREALEAAGEGADRQALAVLVRDLAATPSERSSGRTFVARPEIVSDAPAPPRRPRTLWIVAGLGLAGATTAVLTTTAPEPVPVPVPVPDVFTVDATPTPDTAPDSTPDSTPVPVPVPAPDTVAVDSFSMSPDTLSPDIPTFDSTITTTRPSPDVPTRDTTVDSVTIPRARVHRLHFTSSHPLHIVGPETRGLAPATSTPLAADSATTFRVTGLDARGPTGAPLEATLRVRLASDHLAVSIGAPADTHYDVDWGGLAKVTPVFGLSIPPGGVTCRLRANDGRTMTFVLADLVE